MEGCATLGSVSGCGGGGGIVTSGAVGGGGDSLNLAWTLRRVFLSISSELNGGGVGFGTAG